MGNKEAFRLVCMMYLNEIRLLELPIVQQHLTKEVVLIEFRAFPHLEVLLRNAIYKLGNEWSYTVVCGTGNYEFMKTMCETTIQRDIRLVRMDHENVTIKAYNDLLMTASFWKQFEGNHLLIIQEDSFLFKGGSEFNRFLQYDYIGAPWYHLPGYLEVGNGGFSLRNKYIMLEIISRITPAMIPQDEMVLRNMNMRKFTVPPEDVYFAKAMQQFHIGKLAPREVAQSFSVECIPHPDPFGGHQFWICLPYWKPMLRYHFEMMCSQEYNSATTTDIPFTDNQSIRFDPYFFIMANGIKNKQIVNNLDNYFLYFIKKHKGKVICHPSQLLTQHKNIKLRMDQHGAIKIFREKSVLSLYDFCKRMM